MTTVRRVPAVAACIKRVARRQGSGGVPWALRRRLQRPGGGIAVRGSRNAWPKLAAAGLALALTGAATAQEGDSPEAPLPSPIVERQEVRFVALDLIVEKKVKGRRVRVPDLTLDRLRVFVGEGEVSLDVFENRCPEQGPAAAVERAAPSSADVGDDPSGPAAESLPVRRYVLYLDLMHLKQEGFAAAFKAARDWATRLQPDDEVMIVTGARGRGLVRPQLPAAEAGVGDRAAAGRGLKKGKGEHSSWATPFSTAPSARRS